MEQQTPNFKILPKPNMLQLKIGFDHLTEIIKRTACDRETVNAIKENSKDQNYKTIISGLLYGILFSNDKELYIQYLHIINNDKYELFLNLLNGVIDESHMELSQSTFERIYLIFDRLVLLNNMSLINLMINLLRCFYPGVNLINNPKNYEKFLKFLETKINFVIDNTISSQNQPQFQSPTQNLVGLVFIKILRILSETHFYKENPDFTTIVQEQCNILKKLYTRKKEEVFLIGRELFLILIQLFKSEIDIVNIILEDLEKSGNYYNILKTPYKYSGYDPYVQICIPPLMEKMIIFILTKVSKASGYYAYYFNWMMKKFQIEKSVGKTILADIVRYIITCFNFYKNNDSSFNGLISTNGLTPRWIILGYILKNTNNELLSPLIKQSIFYDWLFYDEQDDHIYLVEPGIQLIFQSVKEYPELTMELIEFLDLYSENFDKGNRNKIRNCIAEVFNKAVNKGIINNLNVLIEAREITPQIKKIYSELIKRGSNPMPLDISLGSGMNNSVDSTMNSNASTTNQATTIIGSEEETRYNIGSTFQYDISNSLNKKNLTFNNPNFNDIQNQFQQQNQVFPQNDTNMKEIDIKFLLSESFAKNLNSTLLKNFLNFRSRETFRPILEDVCKKYIQNQKHKNPLESKLNSIDPSYLEFLKQFSIFYLNVFKDEIFLSITQSAQSIQKPKIFTLLFEFLFLKSQSEKEFNLISDITKKIFESNTSVLIHFILFISQSSQDERTPVKIYSNCINRMYNYNRENVTRMLLSFMNGCIDSFYLEILNTFFILGFKVFKVFFYDEPQLILNIILYANVNSVNSICLQLMSDKSFILIEKNFFKLIELNFDSSEGDQNNLWKLILAQGIPGYITIKDYIENFIKFSSQLGKSDVIKKDNFFYHFCEGLKLFKMDKASAPGFALLFEFHLCFWKYVYGTLNLICDSAMIFFWLIDAYIEGKKSSDVEKIKNFLKLVRMIMYMENEKDKDKKKTRLIDNNNNSLYSMNKLLQKTNEIGQKFQIKLDNFS